MEVMIVDGKRYLINTELEPHVLDKIVEDILKHYAPDVPVEFVQPLISDLL